MCGAARAAPVLVLWAVALGAAAPGEAPPAPRQPPPRSGAAVGAAPTSGRASSTPASQVYPEETDVRASPQSLQSPVPVPASGLESELPGRPSPLAPSESAREASAAGSPAAGADFVLGSAHHGIIIDAGSSGSRAHVFSWEPRPCDVVEPPPLIFPRQVAAKALRPGLSSGEPEALRRGMRPLLDFAEEVLAERRADWHRFPIYVFATAGLRRQRPEQRDKILNHLRDIFANSSFFFEPENVKILSGEEEGTYGWLALNADLGTLERPVEDSFGVLDLGGASLQITFVPSEDRQVLQHSYPVLLRGQQTNVYSSSYLQFGVFEAQRLLQRQLLAETLMAEKVLELEHPCLPVGKAFPEVLLGDAEEAVGDPPLKAVWHGRSNYEQCEAKIAELFDKRAACYHPPCSFSGRYQPRLGARRFRAFSTFSWVVKALALPPNRTTVADIENAARYVCKMEWSVLQSRWHDLPEQALRTLCFSASYIVVLLRFALGFDQQSQQIDFTAGNSDGGDISWAFGAMIWEVNHRYSRTQPVCLRPADQDRTCSAPDL